MQSVYANDSGGFDKDLFFEKVHSSQFFNEYKTQMISDQPILVKDYLDENREKAGYIAQYEIEMATEEVVNTSDGNNEMSLKTTITSLLTFLYNQEKGVMEVLLIDYSSIEKNGNIYLKNLTNNDTRAMSVEDNENEELQQMQKEMDTKKEEVVLDAERELLSSKKSKEVDALRYQCNYWQCTEHETGGGNYHGDCAMLAGSACTFMSRVAPVGSLICVGVNLIGCYVPKYKICVDGFWSTNYCPIQA